MKCCPLYSMVRSRNRYLCTWYQVELLTSYCRCTTMHHCYRPTGTGTGTRYQVPGTRYQVPGTGVPGTLSARRLTVTLHPGPGTSTGTLVPYSSVPGTLPGTRYQVVCTGGTVGFKLVHPSGRCTWYLVTSLVPVPGTSTSTLCVPVGHGIPGNQIQQLPTGRFIHTGLTGSLTTFPVNTSHLIRPRALINKF